MKSGSLRHRITIQKNTPTTDTYGQRVDSWSDVETVYADVTPVSWGEGMRAGQRMGDVTHRITTRYRADLGAQNVGHTPKYRLRYGPSELVSYQDETQVTYQDGTDVCFRESRRTFEIQAAVDVDERHRMIEMRAREVVL